MMTAFHLKNDIYHYKWFFHFHVTWIVSILCYLLYKMFATIWEEKEACSLGIIFLSSPHAVPPNLK